jgi:hypothetical protein
LQAAGDSASVCAAIALIDGDASIMSPLNAAGMAIEQELAHLHHQPACDQPPALGA